MRAVALLLHVSVLGCTHLGTFLVGGSNLLCHFSWCFLRDYLGMGSSWAAVYFLVSILAGCDSVVKHLPSVIKILCTILSSCRKWKLSC
jgi:hypothetical protein